MEELALTTHEEMLEIIREFIEEILLEEWLYYRRSQRRLRKEENQGN